MIYRKRCITDQGINIQSYRNLCIQFQLEIGITSYQPCVSAAENIQIIFFTLSI